MILTEEHQMIRDALRTFASARLAPNAARWDREHHFPKDELKELARLGAFGVAVPEQYGGAGLDYVALALVLEEIAAGDGGTSTSCIPESLRHRPAAWHREFYPQHLF